MRKTIQKILKWACRKIPFSREIYIEQDDFMENPPKKYFRLFPGNEVRLKNAYFIKCEEVIKDENGKSLNFTAPMILKRKAELALLAEK